ncbi:MAG: 3'(2'),5'-bisphosphate nucleotidase CysQ [Saprospiraceae bacterium]|nr:3'(2'),5'-bisphosphate nucleotidase CysQ [Saprospiraceae bacterium]
MNLLAFRAPLKDIVLKAGEEILQIYNQPALFAVEHKADDSPLTAADRAANAVICEALEGLEPKFPILSEENKAIPYTQRKDFDFYWCVDPLDGTKEFIKRNGEFTVNIALIRRDRPVVGIVHIPVSGETYFGTQNEGAFYSKEEGWEQMASSSFSYVDIGLKILCSRSHLSDDTKKYVDQFKEPELLPRGSSLKFLEIARGHAHIYPRLGPTMEWDTAAAQIILEESGGQVVEFASGQPLGYNKESLLNPDFLALGALKEK